MLASKARRPIALLLALAFAFTASIGATTFAQDEAQKKRSPLEWLKKRSPTKRWSFLKTEADRQKEAKRIKAERKLAEQQAAAEAGRARLDSGQPNEFPSFDESGSSPALPAPNPVFENANQSSLLGPIQPVAGSKIDIAYEQTTSDPNRLKRVTEILPYGDYQPSMTIKRKVDPSLEAPEEVSLSNESVQTRQMEPLLYQWQASNLHHYPLYFQDANLERYGHAHHPLFQPFISTGRMGLQLVGLPYQMTIDPVCKNVYTLGWYRPGECAPKQVYQVPWNTRAAINQAAVTTGAFFALP
jgi:hypothetical protein